MTNKTKKAHVVVVPLGAAEVGPRGLRRPKHVPVVPQQAAVEGVGHGARRVRADVGEGEVGVARAQQPVGEPSRRDEEPSLFFSTLLNRGEDGCCPGGEKGLVYVMRGRMV